MYLTIAGQMTFTVVTTHLGSGCTVYTQIQGNTIGTSLLIVPIQEYVKYVVLKYFFRLVKIYTLHKFLFYGHKHIRLKFGGATSLVGFPILTDN